MLKSLMRNGFAALSLAMVAAAAHAQDALKIGLILPMTGPFASTGRQIEAAARLYLAQNGSTVAGRKVERV
jgi:branched-chain amino acid transport system substrate-binding protein